MPVFRCSIDLAAPLDDIFRFFADARNLQELTPPWLRFRVTNEGEIPMAIGTQIDYRLRVHGLPLRWRSEITAWDPPNRFVDEQLVGPYRTWIHEHRFEVQEREGEKPIVVATDEVRYQAPGGWLVHRFLVAPDLRRIFAYRTTRLRERFGAPAT